MKSDTEEKYLQQVNRVIDYINSHLNEPLRVETLAREVCLSEYHFHRIMRAYLHEPLATYIARQRVERAVMYLQMKNIRHRLPQTACRTLRRIQHSEKGVSETGNPDRTGIEAGIYPHHRALWRRGTLHRSVEKTERFSPNKRSSDSFYPLDRHQL